MSPASAAASPRPLGVGAKLMAFGRMVRFSHTIFGLPFAMASFVLAHRWAITHGQTGFTWPKLGWVLLAFTGARTAAMGFNRWADRHIDAANPRTQGRELVSGEVHVRTALGLTFGALALFFLSAFMLGQWPARLSPLCALIVLGYSYMKRWSWGAHLVLGVALALAPGGAWLAVTDSFSGWQIPTLLMVAVGTWVAGFDIIYALQDEHFDRDAELHSIPVRFGTRGALIFSAVLHAVTIACLLGLHRFAALGIAHAVGLALIAAILVYEHWIVRPGDLTRINKAFFDLNGYVSIAYLLAILLEPYIGKS